jgi:hypothetical protein
MISTQVLSAKITIGSASIALSRFLGLGVTAFSFSLYQNPLLHIALAWDSLAAYGKSRNPIKNAWREMAVDESLCYLSYIGSVGG